MPAKGYADARRKIYPMKLFTKTALLCLSFVFMLTTTRAVAQSNLVFNGSFEDIDAGWEWGPSLGVHPNANAADGQIHITVMGFLQQDLPTVSGRLYVVSYARRINSIPNTIPTVIWNGMPIGPFTNFASFGFWTYAYAYAQAESNLTKLRFEGGAPIDDVRGSWVEDPIVILTQPSSRSAFEGGTVSFAVSASGAPPLLYQWLYNGAAIDGATNQSFTVRQARPNQSGDYSVIITNTWRSTVSSNAALQVVPPPTSPVIISQPVDDVTPAGYAASVRVFAVGEPPLFYRWSRDGAELPGGTNRAVTFESVQSTDAGTYQVVVSNRLGTVLSLPAVLTVTNATGGGRILLDTATNNAPIFDVDGVTPLAGSNFLYHVYAGRTAEFLRPLGAPSPFLTGGNAGYIRGYSRVVPDVPANQTAYVQVRAWEAAAGATYEEARAAGGKFGFSEIEPTITSTFGRRVPMESFSLRAGEPFFFAALLAVGERLPGGKPQIILTGEPGVRYLVETREPPNNWVPLLVLTNTTGTSLFTDPNELNRPVQFYRARMLD